MIKNEIGCNNGVKKIVNVCANIKFYDPLLELIPNIARIMTTGGPPTSKPNTLVA